VLSKRLHSIYLLRLFNDCWAVLSMTLSILAYQSDLWTLGSALFSTSVAIKMNGLLYLPAIGLLLTQALGVSRTIRQITTMLSIQVGWRVFILTKVLYALPFVLHHARSYMQMSFNFNRQFLYTWSVNWKFLDEETFLSTQFSRTLLATHAVLLLLFANRNWTRPRGGSVVKLCRSLLRMPSPHEKYKLHQRLNPTFILTTFTTCNLIGVVCARSLHYQFYSWFAWWTPYLLFKGGFHPVLTYALWFAQEVAWNIYPSAAWSSAIVVAIPNLILLAIFFQNQDGKTPRRNGIKE